MKSVYQLGVDDKLRAERILDGVIGKRLTYQQLLEAEPWRKRKKKIAVRD